jgi:serine/threonine-protein kinase
MAPEQALGKEADVRSDVYSAGIVFYELFTGKVPFSGNAALEVAMKHVQERPKPPHEVKPSVPPAVEAIVLKMIAKEPAERYPSFAEAYAALMRVPVPAAPAAARAA